MRRDSTASNWRPDSRVVIALAALGVVLFYLTISALTSDLGFPLDDAWIHLTYARNLAEHGEWAFRIGERSAGSTSPLWTALLSIGFLVGLGPYIWTYLLGWAVLASLGVCAEHLARTLVPSYSARLPWAGLFFVFAWHLTWSAVSGMETLLHALLILAVLGALLSGSRRYLSLGLLIGLSVWVRPDGLTLLGPVIFSALLSERTWLQRREALWQVLLGFGSLFLPYVLFNLALSGNPMPSTFYAKQAEYGAYWQSRPLPERLMEYSLPVLASPFLLLIPAVALWLRRAIRSRSWGALAGLIWVFGYIAVYFVSLPAYQHGRYIIPAFPVMYLWGILGLLDVTSSFRGSPSLLRAWQIGTIALSLAFAYIGAVQNARDVSWIQSEMVATAKWVDQNIRPDARLAVHDIGALGFYVRNPIVDLAGLITPEVVPFIRDEARLARYLDSKSVDYLITLPGFYPRLTSQLEPIFEGGMGLEPAPQSEHMRVYRWD